MELGTRIDIDSRLWAILRGSRTRAPRARAESKGRGETGFRWAWAQASGGIGIDRDRSGSAGAAGTAGAAFCEDRGLEYTWRGAVIGGDLDRINEFLENGQDIEERTGYLIYLDWMWKAFPIPSNDSFFG